MSYPEHKYHSRYCSHSYMSCNLEMNNHMQHILFHCNYSANTVTELMRNSNHCCMCRSLLKKCKRHTGFHIDNNLNFYKNIPVCKIDIYFKGRKSRLMDKTNKFHSEGYNLNHTRHSIWTDRTDCRLWNCKKKKHKRLPEKKRGKWNGYFKS